MMASPLFGSPPSTYLEWEGDDLSPVAPAPNSANSGSFVGNFMVLPNGQIATIEGNYENKVAANVRSPTEATGYVSMS